MTALAVGLGARGRAVVEGSAPASPLPRTAFIAPSTFAISRRVGTSGRVHAQPMPRGPRRGAPGDAEQLDPVAQFLRVADVLARSAW